jgi:hypothetical protein
LKTKTLSVLNSELKCRSCTWRTAMHKGASCADIGITEEDEICANFRSKEDDLHHLDALVSKVRSKMRHNDWLPSNPTAAYIVCVAQGPWKYERREKITQAALRETRGKDMRQISSVSSFPFDWQKGLIGNLNKYLNKKGLSFKELLKQVVDTYKSGIANKDIDPAARARHLFYKACGAPDGPKVLSMFLRDYLHLPTFPIDRHVRRMLVKHKLPVHEAALIALCNTKGVDPMMVAIGTVRIGSNGAIG